MISYHGNRVSSFFCFLSQATWAPIAKQAAYEKGTFYAILIDFLCAISLGVVKTTFAKRDKRQTPTQSSSNISALLLSCFRIYSVHLEEAFFFLPFISSFHSFSHHRVYTYLTFLFSLFYLCLYVTISPRLLFVLFSECFIINDPEESVWTKERIEFFGPLRLRVHNAAEARHTREAQDESWDQAYRTHSLRIASKNEKYHIKFLSFLCKASCLCGK